MEKQDNYLKFEPEVLVYPLLFVLLIWLVFWFEIRFGFDFNYLGVRPGEIKGLRGIIFSPFIHSDIKHLFNNTIPLFVLSMSLFYFYREVKWKVLLYGIILTGLLTWVIGRPANHIGASGVIYLLASFLFFKGIFSKYYRLIALSLIVVFLYGGMVWFVVPVEPGISWEGHLSGLAVGLLFALIFKHKILKRPKFEWEKPEYKEEEDAFMKHFDENGNFVGTPLPFEEEEKDSEGISKTSNQVQINQVERSAEGNKKITYRYIYKKSGNTEG